MNGKQLPEITKDQHIFPRASIKRFCNSDGHVCVVHKTRGSFPAPAKDTVFCALRAWSQRAEIGYMQLTENRYQRLAHSFLTRDGQLNATESAIISEMFILWNLRAKYKTASQNPVPLVGISGDNLTPEIRERCEKLGVITVDPQGAIAAREFHGEHINGWLTHFRRLFKDTIWTCKVFEGENIVVPDQFTRFAYIPLAPTRVFIDSGHLNFCCKQLNELSVKESREFCFQFVPSGVMRTFKQRIIVRGK